MRNALWNSQEYRLWSQSSPNEQLDITTNKALGHLNDWNIMKILVIHHFFFFRENLCWFKKASNYRPLPLAQYQYISA